MGTAAPGLFAPASAETVGRALAERDGRPFAALLAPGSDDATHEGARHVMVRVRAVLSADGSAGTELAITEDTGERSAELTPFGLWCADLTAGVNTRDHVAAAMYGTAESEHLTLSRFLARIHSDDLPELLAVQQEASARPGRSVQAQFRFRGDDGSWRWLTTRACVFRIAGRPVLVGASLPLGTSRDGDDGDLTARRVRSAAELLFQALSPQTVVDLLLDEFPALLSATQATVALIDGRRLRLHRCPAPPRDHRAPNAVRLDAALPMAVTARTGRPRFLTQQEYLALAPNGATLVAEPGTEAWLLLPLSDPLGKPLGAWALGQARAAAPDEALAAAAREVARLAGGALARTGGTQPLLDLVGAFQDESARPLPPTLPGLALAVRHQQSHHDLGLGGDWYDLIDLADGTLLIAVGDVQGHGAGAAPLMARVRTLVRAHALTDPDPGHVLTRVNDFLDRFPVHAATTCTLLHLDTATGRTRAARAAHLPLLLATPDGRVRTESITGGIPLGVLPDQTYPTEELHLPPATLLALTTDGLVEGPDLPLETGLRRLGAVLATWDGGDLEALADRLFHQGGGTGHHDDATLLLIALTGRQEL
ncbi:SpoIIE family protein phosphatase [Kitasatospora purpeofusca]|uniref:SpoIIE family protein phosphatase n=1 Tax=Kitasatospora purpeofusca TaxID=67352 RepID=UPI0030EFF628